MHLRQGKKQAARPKSMSLCICLPGRSGNAHRLEQARCQIRYQIASCPALYKDSCQIWSHIVIYILRSGRTGKRKCQGHFHPVLLLIQRTLTSHQFRILLSQAHGQQIPYRGLQKILSRILRNILRKSIH